MVRILLCYLLIRITFAVSERFQVGQVFVVQGLESFKKEIVIRHVIVGLYAILAWNQGVDLIGVRGSLERKRLRSMCCVSSASPTPRFVASVWSTSPFRAKSVVTSHSSSFFGPSWSWWFLVDVWICSFLQGGLDGPWTASVQNSNSELLSSKQVTWNRGGRRSRLLVR